MTLAAEITFRNISGSYQNIILEIMYTLYKFLFLRIIIGNSVKKRDPWCPEGFRIENINKIFAYNHGRHNQRCIFRIDLHLLCQHMIRFAYRIFITLHELFPGYDLIFHFLLEDHICNKISHKDHVFNIPVFQVQTLEIGQVIADKFLHKLIIMDGGFLQLLKSLADTQASHFQSLGGHQGILVKKRNLQASAAYIQYGSSLLDHFLESFFNGCNRFIAQKMLLCTA